MLLPTQGSDAVTQAFDAYEQAWRQVEIETAAKIEAGEITTQAEVHRHLKAENERTRKDAFRPIAEAEQKVLGEEWTPEKHAMILRGYAK